VIVERVKTLSIVLLKRVEKRLGEESEKRGATEEVVIEALLKMRDEPINPDEKTEIHLKLCEKYMDEAEEYPKKRDRIQASEKACGAAFQVVKAPAAKEEREPRSHASLWEYMDEIAERLRDKELSYLRVEQTVPTRTLVKTRCRVGKLSLQ